MTNTFKNFSYVIGVVLVLVCLTFFSFFFNNPFLAGTSVLTVTQFISEFAWVMLVIGPPLILTIKKWNSFTKTLFLVVALFWPATLIAIRIILLVEAGDPYLGYLISYPIFIFTDILVPAIYVLMWVRLQKVEFIASGRRSAEIVPA